jgi:hypothetical protein
MLLVESDALFFWETEGKRPLGRPKHRWMYNIKRDLREMIWAGLICLMMWTNGGLL